MTEENAAAGRIGVSWIGVIGPSHLRFVVAAGVRCLKPMSITAFLANCTSTPRATTVE